MTACRIPFTPTATVPTTPCALRLISPTRERFRIPRENSMPRTLAQLGGVLLLSASLSATIFSSITGLIHDPQHRPVQGAKVTVQAENSTWSQTVTSDGSGQFRFDNLPLGNYTIRVEAEGFVI